MLRIVAVLLVGLTLLAAVQPADPCADGCADDCSPACTGCACCAPSRPSIPVEQAVAACEIPVSVLATLEPHVVAAILADEIGHVPKPVLA